MNANGLMSVASFEGLDRKILGGQYRSPVGFGPLPDLQDVRLTMDDQAKAAYAVKSVADEKGMPSVVPLD